MNDAELGGIVRMLRQRRSWRQTDLGRRAGVSGGVVGLVERGRADLVSVPAIRQICQALEVRLGWEAGFRGTEIARLRDRDHARLADLLAGRLSEIGWRSAPEVSFNHFGERGRIDLLAYHSGSRIAVVAEVKTVIADLQDLLGSLDVKCRLGIGLARSLGWQAGSAVPLLLVAESSTNRRRIADHPRLFARFSVRGPRASAWLRHPADVPGGLLLFRSLSKRSLADARRAGQQRIRLPLRSVSVTGLGPVATEPEESV